MVALGALLGLGAIGVWLRLSVSGPGATGPALVLIPTTDPRQEEALLQSMRQIRRQPHRTGWSVAVANMVTFAAAGPPRTPEFRRAVRAEVVASLAGVDAWAIRRFPQFGAAFMATDRTGSRLLLGGSLDARESGRGDHARLLLNAALPLAILPGGGQGPVAFRRTGSPVQLIPRSGREGQGDELVLVDLVRGEAVTRFELGGRLAIEYYHQVALAPDASVVAAPVGDEKGEVHLVLWDGDSGGRLHEFPFASCCVTLAAEGSLVAAGGAGGQVRAWSIPSGRLLASFRQAEAPIRSLALVPVVPGPRIGQAVDRPPGQPPAPGVTAHLGQPPAPGVTAHWLLAVGNTSGTIVIREVQEDGGAGGISLLPAGEVVCRTACREVAALGFASDATLLASCGEESAQLWDPATGQLLLSFEVDGDGDLQCLTFSPGGRELAFGSLGESEPGSVSVWDLREGSGIQLLRGLQGPIVACAVSSGHNRPVAAAFSEHGQGAVWDCSSGRRWFSFPTPKGMGAGRGTLLLNSDSSCLAFAHGAGATLWSIPSGAELHRWALPVAGAGTNPGNMLTDLMLTGPRRMLLVRGEVSDRTEGDGTDALLRRELRSSATPGPSQRIQTYELVEGQSPTLLGEIELADLSALNLALNPERSEPILLVTCCKSLQEGLDHELAQSPPPRRGTVTAVHAVSGHRIWSLAFDVPPRDPSTPEPSVPQLDPTHTLAAIPAAGKNGEIKLIEVATGHDRGSLPKRPFGLGPRAEIWTTFCASEAETGSIQFYGKDPITPIFEIPGDAVPVPASLARWTGDGRFVAWGHRNGGLLVCELPRINDRLSQYGLGW